MIIATSLYAALSALIYTGLSANVVRGRRQHSLILGDGGHADMQTCIRAHGNFVEYTPFFLILLAMAEYQGLPVSWVNIFGTVFIIGRLSHAYGILVAEPQRRLLRPRMAGMIITFSCLIILAVILIVQRV